MNHRIHQLQHQALQLPKINQPNESTKPQSAPFKEFLAEVQDLKVSKHAEERLSARNIIIDQSQWQRISQKIDEAKHKGITDSLIVMDNAALVVSTKNNTVVTAMDRTEAGSKVFTNINGTILMNE